MREPNARPSDASRGASPRMFKSDFLEYFSHVHPYTPVVVFVPVVLYFLYKSFGDERLGWWLTLLFFGGGLLLWSFLEYILHRYVFHLEINTSWGKRLHFFLHGVHHDYPNDATRLVLPPGFSIPMAFLFYYLFRWMVGELFLPSFFAGFVLGYLIYDMTHFALHHYNFNASWWKKLKHHHMKHHFMDSENGFGVSSMIWDYVFQTYRFKPKKKTAKAPEN